MNKIQVTCKCGEPITPSMAAKALRANRKKELTSEQAKEMRKKKI